MVKVTGVMLLYDSQRVDSFLRAAWLSLRIAEFISSAPSFDLSRGKCDVNEYLRAEGRGIHAEGKSRHFKISAHRHALVFFQIDDLHSVF